MPANPTTISVRKADGSIVRMTLAELEAYKKEQPAPAVEKPRPPRTHALATTAPVPQIFVDEAKAKQQMRAQRPSSSVQQPKSWQKTDAASPLEETNTPVRGAASADDTPIGNADEAVGRILKATGWNVSDELKKRLAPVIVSRVKDVRTDAQFLVHAMTPTHRGGVGLSPDQAEKLLSTIQSILPKPVKSLSKSPPPSASAGMMSVQPSQGKPLIQDIKPPPSIPQQMGPVEEFSRFSLIDFRRLGKTTDASLSRLKEKFDTLKGESYLLFMDVRDAWYESPLYGEYIDRMTRSLAEKRKLPELVAAPGSKEGLTTDIVKAVVEINKYISV